MDSFRIVSKIGHGSYGQVWLVKHKKDKKHYVLKQINLENASQREVRAAHLEVQLLSSLRHPNIVRYRDAFKSGDNHLFIAMSYCEGGDLYKKIKEQKGVYFEEIQVVEWFIQLCMALQYLHERNILHRDLKTQNIFLTRNKVIKVGDLGIAKVLDSESAMATTLIGTPYYMSPELFSNKPYNHKSDVWALGCCIYEIATLRHAFNANDINALMYKILRGKLPCMPRQYSGELVNLIRVMLNHNPDQRPTVSRILRDPFVKKNISVFLEGTKVSMQNASAGSPRQKKSECIQLVDAKKMQELDEAIQIRQVAGKESLLESNSLPRQLHEKEHADIDLHLKGHCVFQPNKVWVNDNRENKHEPMNIASKECNLVRSPRISSSRSTSSEESYGMFSIVDEVISSALVVTGSEIKLEERNIENLIEQKNSPRHQKKKPLEAAVKEALVDCSDCRYAKLAGVHSVYSAMEKRSWGKVANVPEQIHRTKVTKVSPTRKRLKHLKPTYGLKVDMASVSRCLIGAKESDIKLNSVTELAEQQQHPKKQNIYKQCPDGYEMFNQQNLSARQRRRAKLRQELQPSGNNEDPNGSGDCKGKGDVLLEVTPCDGVTMEQINPTKPNHLEHDHKNDEDLTTLLTLLNITLHDDRSSPTEESTDYLQLESGTMDTNTRLRSRVKLLHRDCVEGLGLTALSEALQMLNNYSSLELENKLQNLLGMAKFVQFIGKIWQLKFCQDTLESFQAGNCDT